MKEKKETSIQVPTSKERKIFTLEIHEPAREIARDTYEISILKPEGFVFLAGQSMKFFPSEEFGSSFSIVSSPEDPYLRFAFRHSDSDLKRALLLAERGDKIALRDVKREGDTFHYPEDDENGARVVMIAGGIGITPFISMLRHAGAIQDERSFILLSMNPSAEYIPFREELDNLKQKVEDVAIHFLFSGMPGHTWRRRFSTSDFDQFLDESTIFYVAGPEQMVEDTVAILKSLSVQEKNIRFKKFKGYVRDDVHR